MSTQGEPGPGQRIQGEREGRRNADAGPGIALVKEKKFP